MTTALPIRLVIVDDSECIRRGIRQVVERAQGIEVVGEAGDGVHALAVVAACRPDVVLMDLAMPVMDGLEATRLIRAAQPSVRVVVVTALPGQERAAREVGAAGFVLKEADPAEVIRAVRSLSEAMPLRP